MCMENIENIPRLGITSRRIGLVLRPNKSDADDDSRQTVAVVVEVIEV